MLNTAIGLGSIYACKYFFGLGDVPANLIGYAVGLTNSFFWNRNWTFADSGDAAWAAAKFILVCLVAYAANLATVLALIRMTDVNAYFAHAIATVPYTVTSYLGSRYFVFRSRPDQ